MEVIGEESLCGWSVRVDVTAPHTLLTPSERPFSSPDARTSRRVRSSDTVGSVLSGEETEPEEETFHSCHIVHQRLQGRTISLD